MSAQTFRSVPTITSQESTGVKGRRTRSLCHHHARSVDVTLACIRSPPSPDDKCRTSQRPCSGLPL
ncbi:hypothetical protein BD414DRAFT_502624 [Trametes punicea]|nr:hypothetical protein BD414DRAFT_502624 [Trametes punicea]